MLKQSRDGAAPTHNDFYHTIMRYDWLDSFLGWSVIGWFSQHTLLGHLSEYNTG